MYRLLFAAVLLLTGAAVRGDPPPGVKTIRVVLHPALPPAQALRYPLLPELRQQQPGNAVPNYRKAIMEMKDAISALEDKKWYERLTLWSETPLNKLPRDQIRAFLRPFDAAMRDVADGARHEYADWDLNDNLRKSGISTPMPDMQEMRQFASLLALRARLAMAEGRLDDAVRDVQTILAIGRHVGHSATLICALLGMALGNIAAQQMDELIQQPGVPNLYWSLTDLPVPYIDLRIPFQGERIMVYGTFPGLPFWPRDDVKPLTPEQADMLSNMLFGLQKGDLPILEEAYKIHLALDLQRKHEKAKKALVDAGWPRDTVEKMPHLQVGLLQGLLAYERGMDEAVKWCNIPYWQAEPALLELGKRTARTNKLPGPDEPAIPIADLMLADSGRIIYSRTRNERKFAALRCLEAIRLYAAGHDGKLPPSLEAIQEVPIPLDPFTGKPFEYRLRGETATLYGAAHARPNHGRAPQLQDALSYEIVLKK